MPLSPPQGGQENAGYSGGYMELETDPQYFSSMSVRFEISSMPGAENAPPEVVEQLMQDLVDHFAAFPQTRSVYISKVWGVSQTMTPTEAPE
jgi:hypothetical protein